MQTKEYTYGTITVEVVQYGIITNSDMLEDREPLGRYDTIV